MLDILPEVFDPIARDGHGAIIVAESFARYVCGPLTLRSVEPIDRAVGPERAVYVTHVQRGGYLSVGIAVLSVEVAP
jgi:hypothetical protein